MTGFQAKLFVSAVLAAAAATLTAQSKTVPDAQIESNVLRALAGAPELSTQNIQTTTVFGTVTLTGNIHDEALRTRAENLVARAEGVKKVVDQLTLGDAPVQAGNNTVAPPVDPNGPDPAEANMAGGPPQDPNGQPLERQPDGTYAPAAPPSGASNQPTYDQQPAQQPDGRRSLYTNDAPPPPNGAYAPNGNYPPPPGYGQRAGLPVVVPAGAVLRIRINRCIDSNHIKSGTPFDGIVLTDITADNAIAVPRGALVTGVVVDAEKTKALSGRGQLSLQLTSISLGGQSFPLQTAVWNRVGADKTTSTVDRAVGLGAVGAIFGALAGGGVGAAVGAGVGAGVGVASSAGSPRGQILVAPESVLTFQTSAPAPVITVSQQEMQRLAYAAGPDPGGPRRPRRDYYGRYYYPGPGYAPVYGGGVVYYGR